MTRLGWMSFLIVTVSNLFLGIFGGYWSWFKVQVWLFVLFWKGMLHTLIASLNFEWAGLLEFLLDSISVQSKLVNSNSLNSNFRITRVFPPVPTFFLHKVTKFTSDISKSDNSRFRLTRGDFLVPTPKFMQKYNSISRCWSISKQSN